MGKDYTSNDGLNISNRFEDHEFVGNSSTNFKKITNWEDDLENIKDFGSDENNFGLQFYILNDIFVKLGWWYNAAYFTII